MCPFLTHREQFDLSSSMTSQVTPAISPASQMQSLEKERFVTLGYGSQDASSWCDNVQLFGSIWLQKFALVVSPYDGTGYIFKARH